MGRHHQTQPRKVARFFDAQIIRHSFSRRVRSARDPRRQMVRGGSLRRTCQPEGERGSPAANGSGNDLIPKRRSGRRSEEHTSELQSLMRISYAVFCLKKKKKQKIRKLATIA